MYMSVCLYKICRRDMVHLHLLPDMTLALQKPTREAVQQLIEQLRGRGKTALTVLLLGADKLQHPRSESGGVVHKKCQ